MKLSNNCFAVTGLYYCPPWSVNAGFIIGNNKTIVIDSGSNSISAQTIFGYAHNIKPDNEILLINTEKHLDHIGGNSYFLEKGVKIYGHFQINRTQEELISSIKDINSQITNDIRRNSNEGFLAFKGSKIVNPSNKIEHEFEIDLGGFCIYVKFTPGHTTTNLSIFHKEDKILYCGDCILPEMIPNLEEGNKMEWQRWIETLDRINMLDIEILVPGHGNIINGKNNIQNEIDRIREILLKAIKSDRTPTV